MATRVKQEVRYKKIELKDLQFDQEDKFFDGGHYADIHKAKWNGKVVAVKRFLTASRKGGPFAEELMALSRLQSHPNVIGLYGACVSEQPYIVLEYAPLSLEKVLHELKKEYQYTSDHVMNWSLQLAKALEYIHSLDMLHRDINPSSILLFENGRVLKLCNFGMSRKLEHTLSNNWGTIYYMAPEFIRGKPYTTKHDVFSFGIVLWEMIARKRPTLDVGKGPGRSNMAILYAWANGARPPPFQNIPNVILEMINKCWEHEPQNRPSIKELRQKLSTLCQYFETSKPLIHEGEKPTQVSLSLFDEAMKEGCVTLELLKMLISGVAGAGKTSTLYMLLGQSPPEIRQSTPCARRPVHVIPIVSDSDGAIWHVLEESDLKSLLAELVRFHEKIENKHDLTPPDPNPPTAQEKSTTVKSKEMQTTKITPQPFAKANTKKHRTFHQEPEDATKLQPPLTLSIVTMVDQAEAIDSLSNPLLESSATEDELVRLIDLTGRQEIHLKRRWISITDTGGQPQFREVLPVFLRQTSLFVHVQKLSEALSDKPVIEYYDDQGKPLSKPIESHLTNEEHVKCAVRSVQSLRFSASEEKPPKMLFVATHEDEEHKSSEKREKKEEKLAELVLPISSQDGVIYCGSHMKNVLFGVNAKCPGDKERQIAATIRNIINGLFPPTGKKIPLRWFVLQLKLQEIARVLGRLVITKQECLHAAKRIHINSEEALDAALEYLDELNIIFYYPKILPDVVFCNIQVIIDKLTELVEHLYKLMEDSDDCGAYTGDWKRFREFGLITEAILANFQTHYVPGIFTSQHLTILFHSLLVIADFQRDNQEQKEYFMPSLLHTIETEKVAKHKNDSKPAVPSLVLHFPDGLLNGVFCFTIASLLSTENTTYSPWKLKLQRDGSPNCLYRNIVQFTVPKYPGIVTLIDRFDFVEVVVGSCPKKLCKAICPLVKKTILQSLAKASKLLNYIPCEPEEAVLCLCEDPNPHPAKVINYEEEKWWVCSKDEATCDELGEMCDIWNDKQNLERMKIADDSLTLSNISSALEDVVDWHRLGTFLGIKKAKLDEIRLDYDKFGQARQKNEMIDLWLRSDTNASWEKLCTALKRVDEGATASRVRATYLPGTLTKDPSRT